MPNYCITWMTGKDAYEDIIADSSGFSVIYGVEACKVRLDQRKAICQATHPASQRWQDCCCNWRGTWFSTKRYSSSCQSIQGQVPRTSRPTAPRSAVQSRRQGDTSCLQNRIRPQGIQYVVGDAQVLEKHPRTYYGEYSQFPKNAIAKCGSAAELRL